jgi:hypothetical protein
VAGVGVKGKDCAADPGAVCGSACGDDAADAGIAVAQWVAHAAVQGGDGAVYAQSGWDLAAQEEQFGAGADGGESSVWTSSSPDCGEGIASCSSWTWPGAANSTLCRFMRPPRRVRPNDQIGAALGIGDLGEVGQRICGGLEEVQASRRAWAPG